MEYKVLADTLASVAAFVAIVSVMVEWYRSARKPLKITRVVIHRKKNETTFILVVKNWKAYPITVKRVDCYRRKRYEVQKKRGGKPEYSELLAGSEMIFSRKMDFDISANGHTDLRIGIVGNANILEKLLFLLETSHGYHELWCKDVTIVEIGKVDVYSLECKHDYNSKLSAKSMFYWKLLKELTISCSRRLRRG